MYYKETEKAEMGTKVSAVDHREPLAGVKRYRVNITLLPELSAERETLSSVGWNGFSRYREAALLDAG